MFSRSTNFAHHHLFILIFVSVAVVLAGNVMAIDQIHQQVKFSGADSLTAPVILARYEQTDEEEPHINSLEPLGTTLTNKIAEINVPISIAVKDLASGDYLGINDKTTMTAASFYKLFTVYEVLQQIDEGQLRLNQAVGFDASTQTVEACIKKSINVSDNDCGRALRKLIKAHDQPLARLATDGFVGTNLMHDYPITTANDVAKLFDILYDSKKLSGDSTSLFMEALKSQEINNRIPLSIPPGVDIAHKTADLEGYSHDGGIVYKFGDYIVVIMSGPWPNAYTEAPPVISELSKSIYNWFSLSKSS